MKKFLVLLSAVLIAGLLCAGASASYWDEGNDGDSWETAYVIDSVEDFVSMHERSYSESGKYYRLESDIDLSSYTDWELLGFNGHLDGQNHTVTVNIHSNSDNYEEYHGADACLFGVVSCDGVAIRNLNVSGTVHAEGNNSDDVISAVGIALQMGSGIIENCRFDGTVEAIGGENAASVYAGGIIRFISKGAELRDCVFNGNVIAEGYDSPEAGGIVCATVYDEGVTIEGCKVLSGSVITANYLSSDIGGHAGGIVAFVGTSNSTIANCVSEATIDGNTYNIGGIAGTVVGEGNTLSGNTWPSEYPEAGSGSYNSTPSDGSSANDNSGGSVIPDNPVSEDTNTELPVSVVEPVTPSPDVMENLASLVSIDTSALHLITQENISPAQEPTPTMRQQMTDDGYEPAYKLNTLNVSEDGHYVFLVNIPEEFVGQKISDIRIYALKNTDIAASIPGVVTGLLNFTEITNLAGIEIDTLEGQVLAVAVLQAGTPFSVYLAKILIMLLAGGCNSGIAIMPGIFLLALILLPLLRRR